MPSNPSPAAFTYPPSPHVRRHGPAGYRDYRSYRPWLRDEFSFRCIYCLMREQWGRVRGEFDLDHFEPQALHPEKEAEYDNLVYVCHTCNLRKGRRILPDATSTLTSENVQFFPDGTMKGITPEAKRIIRFLLLNSPKLVQWRRTWIRIVELAEQHDPDHYRDVMGYPDDLPDLANCQAPSNSRQEGLAHSYFARRQRGELAETYLF